jgi:hypothetical protein
MRGRCRSWHTGAASANLENAENWKILVTRVKRIRLPLLPSLNDSADASAARIPL